MTAAVYTFCENVLHHEILHVYKQHRTRKTIHIIPYVICIIGFMKLVKHIQPPLIRQTVRVLKTHLAHCNFLVVNTCIAS